MKAGSQRPRIELPASSSKGKKSLEELLKERRSHRDFRGGKVGPKEISQLLYAAQGINRRQGRTVPSAGACYPLEIYIISAEGLFRYEPEGHSLIKMREGDLRRELARAALDQGFIEDAQLSIVIAAVFERVTARYGKRGVNYTFIEVGHCAQNVLLQAVSLGLGAVPVGAFHDDEVKGLLEAPEECEPLYIIPVGMPK